MLVNDHKLGKLSLLLKTSQSVFDPMRENVYQQVTTWILPVIDEVFDKPQFSDYQINLNKLEIDLGVIPVDDYLLKNVGNRLRNGLEDELNKRVLNITSSVNSNETVLPVSQAKIVLLFNFLKYGFFSKSFSGTPDHLLDQIIVKDPDNFLRNLKDNFNDKIFMKRLVWQFDIVLLEKILALLEPSEYDFIRSFIAQVKNIQIDNISSKNKCIETDSVKFYRQIFEFTFSYLLLEKVVQFNRINFIYTIINKISNHYNIGFNSLLYALIDFFNTTKTVPNHTDELFTILYTITNQNNINECNKNKKSIKLFETTDLFLTSLHSGNSPERVIRLWDLMYGEDKIEIKKFIYLNINNIHLVRNLVESLDKIRIQQCIHILDPQNYDFIIEFIDIYDQFVKNTTGYGFPIGTSQVYQSNIAYEFVIIYLVKQKNNIFNENELLRSVLIGIANHHNISYTSLLFTIFHFFQKNVKQLEMHTNLLSVLTTLNDKHTSKIEITQINPSKQINDQFQTVALYENLLSFLFDGIGGIESSVYVDSNTIDSAFLKIFRNRSDLFRNLLLKIRTDENVPKRIISFHGVHTFELIITYLLRLKLGDNSLNTFNIQKFLNITNKFSKNDSCFYSKLYTFLFDSNDKTIASINFQIEDNFCEQNYISRLLKEKSNFNIIELFCKHSENKNTQIKPEQLLNNISLPVLINYLYFFIKNPSLRIKNGISKESLLQKLQNEYPNELVNVLSSIILQQPDLHSYINLRSFVINDATICLLANEISIGEQGSLISKIFRLMATKFYFSFVSILTFIINARTISDKNSSSNDYLFRVIIAMENSIQKPNDKKLFWIELEKLLATTHLNNNKILQSKLNNYRFNNHNDSFPIASNQKYSSDISTAILSDVDISSFFSSIETSSCKNCKTLFHNKTVLKNLINHSPEQILHFLKNRKENENVLKNISDILSENDFYQLLYRINTHACPFLYRHFTLIRNVILSNFQGESVVNLTKYLQMIILRVILQENSRNKLFPDLLFEIVTLFKQCLSETDRNNFSLKVYDEIEKNNCYNNSLIAEYESLQHDSKNHKYYISYEKSPMLEQNQKFSVDLPDEKLIYDEIPVSNAGIVIGAAYFEKLFTMLNLIENKSFVSENAIQKAMKCLFYFATKTTDPWEHELTLNKIICGIPLNHPFDTRCEITEKEKETVDGLVKAIITNWPVMKNTTPEGLRESFLQRSGYLEKNNDVWLLKIDKRSFDMLVDSLPWGLSMIKFPWMKEIVQVEWKWN